MYHECRSIGELMWNKYLPYEQTTLSAESVSSATAAILKVNAAHSRLSMTSLPVVSKKFSPIEKVTYIFTCRKR